MKIILWNDDQGRVVALTPPGGMTAEDAQADASLVPQDRASFIVENADMPDAPLSRWRLSADGVVTAEQVPPPAEPTPEEKLAASTGLTVAELKALVAGK